MTEAEEKALLDFFQATKRAFKGDHSEWARAYKRSATEAIEAIKAVRAGKSYDYIAEVWK
jgi:hypothetical protein